MSLWSPPPISLVPLRLAVLRAVADCGVDRRTIDLRAWLCGHGACAGGPLTILSLVPVIPVKQQGEPCVLNFESMNNQISLEVVLQ